MRVSQRIARGQAAAPHATAAKWAGGASAATNDSYHAVGSKFQVSQLLDVNQLTFTIAGGYNIGTGTFRVGITNASPAGKALPVALLTSADVTCASVTLGTAKTVALNNLVTLSPGQDYWLVVQELVTPATPGPLMIVDNTVLTKTGAAAAAPSATAGLVRASGPGAFDSSLALAYSPLMELLKV